MYDNYLACQALNDILESIESKRLILGLTMTQVSNAVGIHLNTYMLHRRENFINMKPRDIEAILNYYDRVCSDQMYSPSRRVKNHTKNRLRL